MKILNTALALVCLGVPLSAETYELGEVYRSDSGGFLQTISCSAADKTITIAFYWRTTSIGAGHGYGPSDTVKQGDVIVHFGSQRGSPKKHRVVSVDDCILVTEELVQ